MTEMINTPFHTVDEEWLASYAAGGLSRAKRLLLACQSTIEPGLGVMLNGLDQIGGSFLETAKGEAVSDGFLDRVMGALDAETDTSTDNMPSDRLGSDSSAEAWAPSPLHDFLRQAGLSLNWKKSGPGVERAPLAIDGEEHLYLLRAQPGLKIPMHSHRGEEWTLLLQGGYHVGAQGYARGDLHREDENCTHQPIIDDDGEPCISLVAVEGKLKFSNPIIKIVQPFIGI